jgi:probable addiction module antidote protein
MAQSKIKTRPFDAAEYLESEDGIVAYLDEAMRTGDPAFIADAIGVVARARGMTQIARDANMSRESLYKALTADGNPEFATIVKVLHAMGFRLNVEHETSV